MCKKQLLSIVFLHAAALLFFACGSERSLPRNVILVTLDTVRADRIGCYGYSRALTPDIDRLASEGVIFENAFTPVPITLPSHATILTGTHPLHHGIHNNGTFILEDAAQTLAEDLKKRGFRTGAVIAAVVLDSKFGLNQGFDYYDDFMASARIGSFHIAERKAEAVSKRGIRWMESVGRDPFFLWLHYFDPHKDYNPPAPFNDAYFASYYDGEIAFVDFCFNKVLEKLFELGIEKDTLIVIVGDHGEGLGQHNEDTHAIFIYDSTMQVPLIFHYPPLLKHGLKIESMVSTMDIRPTILDLLGLPPGDEIQGQSLLPAMRGEPLRTQPIILETNYPAFNYGWSPLGGIRTEKWKYIHAPRPELYALSNDQDEEQDLSAAEPAQLNVMAEMYWNFRASMERADGQSLAKKKALDEEMEQKLKSLGYVWAAQESESRGTSGQGEDPKDMVKLQADLNIGMTFLESGKTEQGVEVLSNILEKNPENVKTLQILGLHFLQKGDLIRAKTYLERAVKASPHFNEARISLGLVYVELKQYSKALQEFKEASTIVPNFPEPYYNIGLVCHLQGDSEEAIKWYQKTLALDPAMNRVRISLAELYADLNRLQEVEIELTKALKSPDLDMAQRLDLASLYGRIGQVRQAIALAEEVVNKVPENLKAYQLLETWYQEIGDQKKALRAGQERTRLESRTDTRVKPDKR